MHIKKSNERFFIIQKIEFNINLAMRLIEVNTNVILNAIKDSSTIKLIAQFEDVIENVPLGIILKDYVVIGSINVKDVFNEFDRLMSEHPYFKLRLCESPIELRFFVFSMHKIPNLRPQVVVGPYRVDLAIPEKKVAIELDGHEFHKTSNQRTHDAQRERYLQKQGWQVIRFTGTEIHKDVFACIDDAIQIIEAIPEK